MTRIAHIVASLQAGGKERIVAQLCRPGDIVITFDPAGAYPAFPLPHGALIALDRRDPARFRDAAAAAIEDHGAAILHAHGHVAAIYAAQIAALSGRPALATLHSALGPDWRWALSIRAALRKMSAIAAVSDPLARTFARLSGRAVITVVPGIAAAYFAPSDTPQTPRTPFVVGMATRLHPVKRLNDAIAAVRQLVRAGRDIRLLIAGSGDCVPDIPPDIAGSVQLIGHVADMPAFYRKLDAFLLCSDDEGTPLALLEAMAKTLPCVATSVGGIPALAGAGSTAPAILLVPPRRPKHIAAALDTLISEAPLRRTLAGRAQDRAAIYTEARQAAAYDALYSAVLSAACRE